MSVGDTDGDYFKDYTPDQIKWTESTECQQLRTYIYDFEGGKSPYLEDAKDYFNSAYTN
jgi:hypothetical protein